VGINPTVALFSAGVVVLCTGACSAIPAQRAAVQRAAEWLNASHSTSSLRQLRGRYALLAVQIALSIVLLISAGLVVRSFGALRRFDLGFVPSNVVTMFAGPLTNQQMDVLLARLTQRKEIEAAGAVYLRPFELGPIGQETTATLEGQAEQAARQNPTLNFQAATPGYFSATRIRLLRGRFFSLDDRSDAQPVALVGATAARRLWPREDPIGRRILLRDERGWRTVVGVVADVPYRGLGDARLDVYEPALQSSSTPNYIAVRTGADPVTVATLVRNELPQIAPRAIVDSVATLDGMVARVIAPWRFTAWLLSALGAVAVLLTTVGLIGSVSLEVTNRRRELALRLALGAQRRDVLHSAARPAAWSSGLGILIGILLAIATARAMRSLLFQIEPLDPATWAAVVGLVIAAVGIATYLPARRAAAFNPVVLLRE
jgi:putative ABC transport system permease protein